MMLLFLFLFWTSFQDIHLLVLASWTCTFYFNRHFTIDILLEYFSTNVHVQTHTKGAKELKSNSRILFWTYIPNLILIFQSSRHYIALQVNYQLDFSLLTNAFSFILQISRPGSCWSKSLWETEWKSNHFWSLQYNSHMDLWNKFSSNINSWNNDSPIICQFWLVFLLCTYTNPWKFLSMVLYSSSFSPHFSWWN